MKNKVNKWIVFIFAVLAVFFPTLFKKNIFNYQTKNIITSFPSPTINFINKKNLKVIKVIDGDTIIVEGDKKVRYIGIDAPESISPQKEIQCFAQEAFLKNKELVEGKYIFLEKDVSETDKYGRLLRYVWLNDLSASTNSALFVNDFLIRQGYVSALTYPPDVKYAHQFLEAQNEARNYKRGLWKSCY